MIGILQKCYTYQRGVNFKNGHTARTCPQGSKLRIHCNNSSVNTGSVGVRVEVAIPLNISPGLFKHWIVLNLPDKSLCSR